MAMGPTASVSLVHASTDVAKATNLTAVGVLGSNGSGTMAHAVGGVLWATEQTSDKLVTAKAEYAATGKARHIPFNGGRSQVFDDAVTLLLLLVTTTWMLVLILSPLPQSSSPVVLPPWPMIGHTSPTSASVLTSLFLVSTFVRFHKIKHLTRLDLGLNIVSTWIGSGIATNTISGTSMASPHRRSPRLPPLSTHASRSIRMFLLSCRQICSSARPWHRLLLRPCCSPLLDVFQVPPSCFGDCCPYLPSHVDPSSAQEGSFVVGHSRHSLHVAAKTPNLLIFDNATGL